MSELPFVSVIISSFNGRRHLEECLLSLRNLNYPADKNEIILIDDGSEDKTCEFVKDNFREVNIIRNRRNLGAAESRNIGIRNAKGKLLAFLDNDVRVEKDWLWELVMAIEEDGRIGICAGKLLFKDQPCILNSSGGVMNIYADAWDRGVFERDTGQYDADRKVFFGCSAAMLARREVLGKIGYFDPLLYVYEDVDLGWRVNLLGYKVIYAPRAIAYHKRGGTLVRSTLRGKYLLERNRIRTMLKNYEAKTLWRNISGLFKFKLTRFRTHACFSRHSRFSLLISALAAWGWNLLYIVDTLKKRRQTQKIKIVTDREIREVLGIYKDASL